MTWAPPPRTRRLVSRGSPRWPRSSGRCARTPTGRCPTWWARSSGCSGWTSRWRPSRARPGRRARRPRRVRGRRVHVRRRPGGADARGVPRLPDGRRGRGVRPGDRAGRAGRTRHADHRARGQGPAVAGGGRARPVRRGEGAGLSRPGRWPTPGGPRTRGCSRSACGETRTTCRPCPTSTTESLAAFNDACAARELAEERRLAYVAVTRAAFWVACTGYWWGEGDSPLGPSLFLDEIRDACEAGAGTVKRWAPPPGEDATNPALAEPVPVPWPAYPGGAALRGRPRGGGAGRTPPGPELPAAMARSPTGTGRWPRRGSGTPSSCSPSVRSGAATPPRRYRCPRGCRCRRWSRWPPTRPNSPARSAAPCPARPRRRPAGAALSTSGWRNGSGSSG